MCGALDDPFEAGVQVFAVLVDVLQHGQALKDYIEMGLLLKRLLCHTEHEVNLLLIVGNVLHLLELLLKSVEVRIELLSLSTDGTATGAAGGSRHD